MISELMTLPSTEMGPFVSTLLKLGSECESVIEIGTGTSSALENKPVYLTGLYTWIASSAIHTVDTYDVVDHPSIDAAIAIGAIYSTYITFQTMEMDKNKDTVNLVKIRNNADLLFLNGKHTYRQVAAELKTYGPCINKYIALFNTNNYGYPFAIGTTEKYPGDAGIQLPILEFLATNVNWILEQHYSQGAGMTVLRKVVDDKSIR